MRHIGMAAAYGFWGGLGFVVRRVWLEHRSDGSYKAPGS